MTAPPQPDWNTYAFQDAGTMSSHAALFRAGPHGAQMAFRFSLPQTYRQTTAAVFNSSGVLIRTLWMRRSYHAGMYAEVWDGLDDKGAQALGGPFTIKLLANNISYNWLGLIGDTEESWSGPNNWDGGPASFFTGATFLNGRAFTANGYNEDGYYATVFTEADPNNGPAPLNAGLFGRSTTPDFMDVTTDGATLYYLVRGYPSYVIAFSTAGLPQSFSQGTPLSKLPGASNQLYNAVTRQTLTTAPAVIDLTPANTGVLTGIAVQRSGVGHILATAHGARGSIASADRVSLWNKDTGAPLGSVTIPNPQRMAFDGNGNLWVVSGPSAGDKLYEVSGVGGANTVLQPNLPLVNPISVAVSPTTGHLFVADGGAHQQIFEFDVRTGAQLSSVGAPGGYGQGARCNARIDPAGRDTPTLWLDPGPNLILLHTIGLFSPFASWISVDDKGDLWIADWTAFRLLHLRKNGTHWSYVNRVVYEAWNKNDTSMPRKAPDRVFGGPSGLLEFHVDWSKPLRPGDPEAPGGNGMWDMVRNWMPCYAAANAGGPGGMNGEMNEAQVMPNGSLLGLVSPQNNVANLVLLPTSGVIQVQPASRVLHSYTRLDDNGNTYLYSNAGQGASGSTSVIEFPRTGFDAQGFPVYGPRTVLATVPVNRGAGDPRPYNYDSPIGPSAGGVFAFMDDSRNTDVPAGAPAFHMGFVSTGGSALAAESMPQQDFPFFAGDGRFPMAAIERGATMGAGAVVVPNTRDVFALFNGNNSAWSCQYFHYRDDGMFLGQFGWQGDAKWPRSGASWGVVGYPPQGIGLPQAPGMCSDVNRTSIALLGQDLVAINGDESYHKGIHVWQITGRNTEVTLTGTGGPGNSISLH